MGVSIDIVSALFDLAKLALTTVVVPLLTWVSLASFLLIKSVGSFGKVIAHATANFCVGLISVPSVGVLANLIEAVA